MPKIALAITFLITSFIGGAIYGRSSDAETLTLRARIGELDRQLLEYKQKNDDLKQTLQLVKRQIQTDRMAYDDLHQGMIESERQLAGFRAKLLAQKKRLDQVKHK